MSFKVHFFFSFSLLFYIADAFNITKLLNEYPDFSTFNSYLSQTSLSGDINSRQTITVLAVDNDNISPLSGKSGDVLKAIMSVHVVLDYYDLKKLQNIPNKTVILTTLYQSSGKARGKQGFLNVTDTGGSGVMIGSAGAAQGANLLGSVYQQPYNISLLQISNVILPVGLDNATNSPPPPSPGPAKSPPSPVPAKSPSPRKAPKSPASLAPSSASSPTNADAPAADDNPSSGMGVRLSLEAVLLIVSSAMWLAVV